MNIAFEFTTSDNPETCFRCTQIGLPPGGIAPGEVFVLIRQQPQRYCACRDCYDRLLEELAIGGEKH